MSSFLKHPTSKPHSPSQMSFSIAGVCLLSCPFSPWRHVMRKICVESCFLPVPCFQSAVEQDGTSTFCVQHVEVLNRNTNTHMQLAQLLIFPPFDIFPLEKPLLVFIGFKLLIENLFQIFYNKRKPSGKTFFNSRTLITRHHSKDLFSCSALLTVMTVLTI